MTEELQTYDVVVIGGGAAGIMAALEAAASGASVALLEKSERLGKKILISGGGKCNITNVEVTLDNYHGRHPRFAQDVLNAFDQHALRAWLASIGLETVVDEEKGKVWPASMTSKSVMAAFSAELEHRGVAVFLGCAVRDLSRGAANELSRGESMFDIASGNGHRFKSRAVVLATGGLAAPQLGADASGLRIAEALGHHLEPQYPALVGIRTADVWGHGLAGLTCEDAEIVLEIDGREVLSVTGSLLFTHYGLSSPAIFRLSREVDPALDAGQKVRLLVNFRADEFHSAEDANTEVRRALGADTRKELGTVMAYVVRYRRLADELSKLVGADPAKRVREIQKPQRDELERLVYRCPFTVTGTLGWARAEVMRGGVDVRKIDPRTMESKLVPGLFICGEMLDIDGDVGGYSFQFAFASGKAAGAAAAKTLQR